MTDDIDDDEPDIDYTDDGDPLDAYDAGDHHVSFDEIEMVVAQVDSINSEEDDELRLFMAKEWAAQLTPPMEY